MGQRDRLEEVKGFGFMVRAVKLTLRMPKIQVPVKEHRCTCSLNSYDFICLHFSFFFLVLKMQELEQRVIEAEQRAENAEKQVGCSLTLALLKAQQVFLFALQPPIQTAVCTMKLS